LKIWPTVGGRFIRDGRPTAGGTLFGMPEDAADQLNRFIGKFERWRS
jgi:hypothetical protein